MQPESEVTPEPPAKEQQPIPGPLSRFIAWFRPEQTPFRWYQAVPVALIILAFVFACLPVASRYVVPLNGDEVDTAWRFCFNQHNQHAKPWAMGSSHSGMYNLAFWIRAIPFGMEWFRTHSDLWNRYVGIGMTAVLLAVAYGFARWMLGHTYGLLVMFLLAFSHFNYFMAVEAGYLNESAAAYLATVWLFLAGVQAKHWWVKLLLGGLTGVGVILCGLLYFSGRLIVVGFLGYAILCWIEDRTWVRRAWLFLLPLVVVCGLAFYRFTLDQRANPGLASFRQSKTQLLARPQLEWAFANYHTDSAIVVAVKNIARSFTAYHHGPNGYHAYQTPHGFLDRYSFWLFLLGALAMLANWRWPAFRMILILFVINNAVLSGLTMLPYPPYHQRVHVGIDLSFFMVALPLWALTRFPKLWGKAGQVVAIAVCLAVAFVNSNIYFERSIGGKDSYINDYGRCVVMASYINEMIDTCQFVTYDQNAVPYPFDYQMNTYNPEFRNPNNFVIPLAYYRTTHKTWRADQPNRRLVFIVQEPRNRQIAQEIERQAPGGRWIREDYEGKPHYSVYVTRR